MEVVEYTDEFQKEIVELIVSIQYDELGIKITADDQPDLKNISSVYQKGKGNFWVAKTGNSVAGTIALIDIGNKNAALRKMFVNSYHRGKENGVSGQLMNTLFQWCRKMDIQAVYLGTIDSMKAAHRFYEKNGFKQISKEDLPADFPLMPVDNVFYKFLFT